MPKLRHQLKANVRIYEDAVRRYESEPGDRAFMVYDLFNQLIPAGYLNTSTTNYSTLVQFGGYAGNNVRDAMRVQSGDIDAVMLTPVIDETTDLQAADYTLVSTEDAGTLTEWQAEQWPFNIIAQPVGKEEASGGAPAYYVASEITSNYDQCADAFFAVMLWRKGLDEDFIDDVADGTEASPHTTLWFGGGDDSWALTIPYDGSPYLWEYDPTDEDAEASGWVRREWTHGNLSAQSTRGDTPEGFWYWIGIIDGKLCVSEDGFKDNFAYYCSTPYGTETIGEGPLRIRQWPGIIAFAHRPLKAATATLTRETVSMPNTGPWDTDDGRLNVPHRVVENWTWATYGTISATLSQIGSTNNGNFSWEMTVEPHSETHESDRSGEANIDVDTYTWPTLKGVRATYDGTVTDNGAQPYVDYEDYVVEILHNTTAEQNAASYQEMHLINTHGEAMDIYEGRAVEILDAGWEFRTPYGYGYFEESEDLHTLDTLWTLEPRAWDRWAEVPLTDILGMLEMDYLPFPVMFGGFTPHEALEWLAKRAGLGPGWYDFEDLDITFWAGQLPGVEPMKFEAGTPIAEVMREVAQAGGEAAIWCENGSIKTGCPYCRTKRTTANFRDHQDNGWNSSGCLTADVARAGASGVDHVLFANPEDATDPEEPNELVDIEVVRRNIGRWDYANSVTVISKTAAGLTSSYTLSDATRLYGSGEDYFGWPVGHLEELDHLGDDSSWTETVARAEELYARLSPNPWYVRGTCLARPSMRVGHVVETEGGNRWNIDGLKWRIVNVATTLRKDGRAMTEFLARQLAGTS